MKPTHKTILFCAFAALLAGGFVLFVNYAGATSDFNKEINYQGKLTTSIGVAVPDGYYCMNFALYDALTNGNLLWSEEWKTDDAHKVHVISGLFSILLGSQTSISSVDFNNASRYLEVQLDATCNDSYEEIFAPRKQLGAVPAAFESAQLGGATWASPDAIGTGTPNSGYFTTVSATGTGQFGTGGILGIDDATNTAGTLKLWSAGANDFYTTFTTGTQSANADYILPTASSDGYLKNTSGALSWSSVDLSGYVPYTGATATLNLGTHDLTTTGIGTLASLNLAATSNQIVMQSAGVTTTLTESGASSNKTITFPNLTGTVALMGVTQSTNFTTTGAGTFGSTYKAYLGSDGAGNSGYFTGGAGGHVYFSNATYAVEAYGDSYFNGNLTTTGTYNGLTLATATAGFTIAGGTTPYTLTIAASGTAALGTGVTNYNAYWSATNTLSSEQYVATSRGGTGASWSAVATGSMPYFSGTGTMSTLTAATSGWLFTSNGANTAPSWQASAGVPYTGATATLNLGTHDLTTTGVGTLTSLNLTATSNQIVMQSAGVTTTLTESGASSNKTITFPNLTGTVALMGVTQSTNFTTTGAGTFGSTYKAYLGSHGAGYFTGGAGGHVYLSTANYGISAWRSGSGVAGYFSDSTNAVTLANGTYAINATGNSLFTGDLTTTGTATGGKNVVNQTADSVGTEVNGFDDMSGYYYKTGIRSDGRSFTNFNGEIHYFQKSGTPVAYFTADGMSVYTGSAFGIGSSTATLGVLKSSNEQTNTAVLLGLGDGVTGSRSLLITDTADKSFNFQHAIQATPTVFFHSDAQSTTEWGSITHDGTDFVFNAGTGIANFSELNITTTGTGTFGAIVLGTGTVLSAGSNSANSLMDFLANTNTGDNAFRMQFREGGTAGAPTSGGFIQYNSDTNILKFGGITIAGADIVGFDIARDTGLTTFYNVKLPDDTYIGDYNTDVSFTLKGTTNSVNTARFNLYETATPLGGYIRYNGDANDFFIGSTGGSDVDAIKIDRGSSKVFALGDLDVAGAITTTGQGTFGSSYINGTYPGYFTDGTEEAFLAIGSGTGSYFDSGTGYSAYVGSSGYGAGYFTDSTNSVSIADGTYAINATGNMLLSGYIIDQYAYNAFDVTYRQILDFTGTLSAGFEERILYADDGSTQIMDWSNVGTSANYYFSSGVLQGDGSGLTGTSDRRVKHDIVSLDDSSLDKVMALNPVSFIYNSDKGETTRYGFVAQDVESIFPSLVVMNQKDEMLSLYYTDFTAILAKAIQEVNLKVDALADGGVLGDGTVSGISTTSYVSKVKTALASLGVGFKDGVASIATLATQSFTTDTATVKYLQMVASNGDIYCTWLDEYGNWQKTKGECEGGFSASVFTAPETQVVTEPETPVVTEPESPTTETPTTETPIVIEPTTPTITEPETPVTPSDQASQQLDEIARQQQATQQALQQAQDASKQAKDLAKQAQEAVKQAKDQAQKQNQAPVEPQALDIISLPSTQTINLEYSADLSLANLPSTITATLSDGSTEDITVIWDDGVPAYNANVSGIYAFSGALVLSGNITNTNDLKANINVVVAEQPAPAEPEVPVESPVDTISNAVQETASSLLNGVSNFVKWIFGSASNLFSSMPIIQETGAGIAKYAKVLIPYSGFKSLAAGLLSPIKNLFSR